MHDFKKFQPLKPRLIENLDRMLAEEVSKLMSMIPTEETEMPKPEVRGGAFDSMQENPFNFGANEGTMYYNSSSLTTLDGVSLMSRSIIYKII